MKSHPEFTPLPPNELADRRLVEYEFAQAALEAVWKDNRGRPVVMNTQKGNRVLINQLQAKLAYLEARGIRI